MTSGQSARYANTLAHRCQTRAAAGAWRFNLSREAPFAIRSAIRPEDAVASPFWFPDPPAPGTPQITVYARTGVAGAAYYSRVRNTIAFFNTACYGQLKSWVLGAVGGRLAGLDGTARRVALARPIAFDNGRAMLDLGRILERGRAFSNATEPLRLGSVFLPKRDFASDAVLPRRRLPSFMARLLLGETPPARGSPTTPAGRRTTPRRGRA